MSNYFDHLLLLLCKTQATVYASQHIWCLPEARINWEGAAERASGVKMGDDGGESMISPTGAAPSRIVGVSASLCTTKSRRTFLLAPAHSGSPRKRAIKRLCACVRTCVRVLLCKAYCNIAFVKCL